LNFRICYHSLKEDLLKAITDEDLEIGDVIVDWPADTSEHKTVAEPVSEFTDEDQAKLDEADKEAQVDAAKVLISDSGILVDVIYG